MCAHTEIISRLMEAIADSKLSKSGFAKYAGLSESNFFKMLDGKQTITRKTLERLAIAHGLSLSWLLDGVGPMYDKPRPTVIQQNTQHIANNSHNHVEGDNNKVGVIEQNADTAALRMKVEMLEKENAWLRTLVENKMRGTL